MRVTIEHVWQKIFSPTLLNFLPATMGVSFLLRLTRCRFNSARCKRLRGARGSGGRRGFHALRCLASGED
jgi:hypothetical protein